MKILIVALSLVCVAHAEPIIGDIVGGVVNLFNGFKVPGTDVKLLGCFMDGDGGCKVPNPFGGCIVQLPPRVFQGGAVKYHHNDVIKRCYQDAVKNGVDTFAIQNGNECWAKDKNAIKHYNKLGAPGLLDPLKCLDGRGGLLRNDVYHIVKTESYPYAKYKGNTECTKFTVQGCFSEKKSFVRNERKLLVYWRYDIKWKNLHPFTRSLVCTCSKAARANNFPYFAVHYWGECWGLKGLNDFNKNTKGDCKHARGESCIGKNKKKMCLADKDFQVYSTKE